jgi:hypothetical protein
VIVAGWSGEDRPLTAATRSFAACWVVAVKATEPPAGGRTCCRSAVFIGTTLTTRGADDGFVMSSPISSMTAA